MITVLPLPYPDFTFVTKDGIVTEVSYTYTLEEEAYSLDSSSPQLCFLSLAAAQKGTHAWNVSNSQLSLDGWTANTDSFTCTWKGVTFDYRAQLTRDMVGLRFQPGSTVSCTVTVEN